MVNTTEICCTAICTVISIGILMALSSSVLQTTREKVSFETVYADRVEKVYTDRIALPPSQPSREAYYCDSIGCIRCDARGDCIRPCGGATCAVLITPQAPRIAQPAQGRPETPRPAPR
jgi:hypothetical protein